jgi:transposase InsO family protein
MPWRELSVMDQREEFVRLALAEGANRSELCRRFGISRCKGYKWLGRYCRGDASSLADRSRRPHHSPLQSDAALEAEVLRIREASNNAWGGRKIRRVMERAGWIGVPVASTITAILRRHGQLDAATREHPGPFQRFERPQPNELLQMDFKGHFALLEGRCHPLTVIDDHSRYALALEACADERDQTVRDRLSTMFRRYGLPLAMLMDNGSPWGDTAGEQRFTAFAIWLMQLGVAVIHGRPYHPQTQGKDERFHRTLKGEVLNNRSFRDTRECQRAFDEWRTIYNHERPHDALDLETPATRYRVSPRRFPEALPAIEYWPGDIVRKVDASGCVSIKSRAFRIGKPFRGQPVALRLTDVDGVFSVHFCAQRIGDIDLRISEPACGFVDIADAISTTPQAQQPQKKPIQSI